jgi:hypothetical protein
MVQENSMDGTERIEPPSTYYAFAALILAIGIGAMIYSFVSGIHRIRENMIRMDVPGEMDMELKHETYTVFLEHDAAAAGTQQSPVTCDVHVLPSEQLIDTRTNVVRHTYTYPGRIGYSFLEFDAPHDATYNLACKATGDPASLKPVVAVGGGTSKGIRIMYLRSFVMMTVATVIALLIFVRVSMLRLKSREEIRARGLRPV